MVVDPRTTVPRGMVSISAAHFSGARAVTRHLIELGHRRIGVVTGPPYWHTRDDRVGGHLAALAEAGVLGDPELMRHGEPAAKTGVRAGGELLDLRPRPTAVVCFNDKVAVGVMEAAAARGLRVPEDLSVAGFDDIDVSRATTPRLTTVRQPLQEMGRTAVTMLMRQLDGHAHEALSMELETRLVVRESTGPAPTPSRPAEQAIRARIPPGRVAWPGPADLTAVTVVLALLSRVTSGGLEITGSGLYNLLALLAEDPHAVQRLPAGGRAVARRRPEHPVKALQVLVSRARAPRPRGYRRARRADTACRCATIRSSASAVLLGAHESENSARKAIASRRSGWPRPG